jgi:hypothetical protein
MWQPQRLPHYSQSLLTTNLSNAQRESQLETLFRAEEMVADVHVEQNLQAATIQLQQFKGGN